MTTATTHRPDVQALRGVAVLMVVVYHAWPGLLPGGYVGVDVFFAISGFVITRRLLVEEASSGGIGLVDFLGRRVRRLLPALAVMIVVVTLLSVLLLNPFGQQQHALRPAASPGPRQSGSRDRHR